MKDIEVGIAPAEELPIAVLVIRSHATAGIQRIVERIDIEIACKLTGYRVKVPVFRSRYTLITNICRKLQAHIKHFRKIELSSQ